jgi:hypothetical protein
VKVLVTKTELSKFLAAMVSQVPVKRFYGRCRPRLCTASRGKLRLVDCSSLVVDHLLNDISGGAGVGVACFYCDYRDEKEQTPTNIIGGILKQFVAALPETPEEITKAFQEKKKKEHKRLELADACQLLKVALQQFPRTYICIDALDESEDSHRKEFLQSLGKVMTNSTRLFLTGRPHVQCDVERVLSARSPTAVQLVANQHDIMKYVAHHIKEDGDQDIMNDQLKEEIVTTIAAASQGMYVGVFSLFICLHIANGRFEAKHRFIIPRLLAMNRR